VLSCGSSRWSCPRVEAFLQKNSVAIVHRPLYIGTLSSRGIFHRTSYTFHRTSYTFHRNSYTVLPGLPTSHLPENLPQKLLYSPAGVTYLPSSREPSTDLIFVALSSKRPLRKIAAKKGSKMHLKAAA
jgi:hypothetical protein